MWQPSERYPDPAVKIPPSELREIPHRAGGGGAARHGFRWPRGRLWFGDGRYLLWSDIPNKPDHEMEEETGAVGVFRKPSNNANGNTRDRQGPARHLRSRRAARHPHRI